MQGPRGVAHTKDCHHFRPAVLRPRKTLPRTQQAQHVTTALIHTSFVTTVSKQARQLTPSPSTCCVRSVPSRRHCRLTAREGAPCPAETHPWQVKTEVSAVTLETCFSHHFTAGSSSSLGKNRCCSQQLKWLPGSNLKPHRYTWLRQRKKHAGLHLAGEHIPPRGAPAGG